MQTPDPWRHAATPHPLVLPIDAFSDNYLWLLRAPDGDAAVAIDPGDAAPVRAQLAESGLRLIAILLTHHHADHVGGVAELVEEWSCPVYGPAGEEIATVDRPLMGGDRFVIEGLTDTPFEVIDVPGHTSGHIAYHCGPIGDDPRPLLFCGDTLFAAGCGRIFEGTPAQMLASLDRLAELDDDTLVYCAHEYTVSNLHFAAAADPESPLVAERLAEAIRMRELGERTVPTLIGIERATNPFLRSDEPAHLRTLAERLGRAPESRLEVFTALREWKNVHRA
ncbi:MAG: hydroxyacylglutathione hydrolase [Burkholderiaceae bacterium]